MKVSAIIVNYNTKDILRECLENLSQVKKALNTPELEVIVVDNASSDGSVQMVKDDFHDVILIETENRGLAAGSNRGLVRATGDYLLYLGTDAFPSAETIEGIVQYMEENREVGVATAKLVLRNGESDMDAHRGFPTPWASVTHFSKLNRLFPRSKLFNRYFLGWHDLDQAHEIDLCISHFMLVKREVFDKVGKWDEDFFVFGEDVDLCYRVKKGGWKIMYLPQWSVLHYKGVTVGRKESKDIKTQANSSSATRKRMKQETTKAMRLFYKKHYESKYPKIVTTLTLLGISFLEKLRSYK